MNRLLKLSFYLVRFIRSPRIRYSRRSLLLILTLGSLIFAPLSQLPVYALDAPTPLTPADGTVTIQ